jgi:putative transposase
MGKLNNRKLRWILKELNRDDGQSAHQIAKRQGITDRWVRALRTKYNGIPINKVQLKRRGRKAISISPQEVGIVRKTKDKYDRGAVIIQNILAENGVKMAHNRIHRILVQEGLARKEPKKSKQRKWVRWERRHSNSMWHTDYTEYDDGTEIILYEDDASRCIMGYGQFGNATTDNAILVFDDAIELWRAVPRELMSDHGSQFCEDENREYRFRNHILAKGVKKHVLARVKHPQTNGKQEKLGGTIKDLMRRKGWTLAEAVKYYNEIRPHMSLYNGHTRTPLIAYYEKMKPSQREGVAYAKGYAYAKKAGSTAWLRLELEKEGLI